MIRRLTRFEPVRYVGVGGIVAVMNNLVLIAGDHVGLGYPALIALSWLLGGTTGYLLHTRYTFAARDGVATRGMAVYLRFMAGVAVGVPAAAAFLWLFGKGLGWPMWITAPAATLVMMVYNYLSARLAVRWRRK